MPPPLDLQSELFSATGGAAAEGISNQLGRPHADRFTLLIREAVQNSWDARLTPAGGVRFQLDGYLLSQEARRKLLQQVFAATPSSVDIQPRLLAEVDFAVLAISDFGTRGLGGPTRGDIVPQPGESTNFVDFMRYIGRPPNRAYAGGTYGFGKAVYFLASSLKTICVHTRFNAAAGMESRFMAAALGPQFETGVQPGRRFTGRHWWGRLAHDGVVDPVIGADADEFAQLLGGIRRQKDVPGTTIYVLAPDFQGTPPQKALAAMGQALIDYFWPKLIDGPDQSPTMSFGLRWQGVELPLPQVLNEPELALLARAFAAALSKRPSEGARVEAIASQRPKKLLGHVALLRQPATLKAERPDIEAPENADSGMYQRALRRPVHHIAVMRAPNFVVKYLEGPSVPYELAEYGGVFRVDADADSAFAQAEPPTHDDWVPDLLLDAAQRTYVRVAHRRLKEVVETFASPHSIEVAGGGAHSVAGFSRLLGGLVPALNPDARGTIRPGSPGVGPGHQPGSGGKRVASPQVEFVNEPTVELVDGVPAMVARFQVSGQASKPIRIMALAKVVIADGFESDPPEGSQQPQVLKWVGPDGLTVAAGMDSCEMPLNAGVCTVAISIPPDAMISVALKADTKGGG
jgi:hypothetical protein